jgi:hypothetical protein
MARGDYRQAFSVLAEVVQSDDEEAAGLAWATIASGYRQLGVHSQAVANDERAISAGGIATLDGLVGRAADEIGLGQGNLSREYLSQARDLLPQVHEQTRRGLTRINWVESELALLNGRSAAQTASEAVENARLLRSPRHLLKSQLIQGVAWQVADDPRGNVQVAEVLRSAHALGITTLVWPAALSLGIELSTGMASMAATAVVSISDHLPAGLGDEWRSATAALRTV